jgi:isoleucyl-tRNA synthetase
MDLKSTLNLPDATFTIPMKAGLAQLEPKLQAEWAEMGLYHRIQEARKDAPSFVLHDGPPYTNAPIHLGTGFNKILKDFVVKSRTMMGFRAPYVPGFDNHGLPIEQAVMAQFREQKQKPDVVSLRKACREHARRYVDLQCQQFQRLGVFGLWERPYLTMDFRFEAGILRVFKELVEKDYVFRGLRPTLWSPTSQTALADTEILYQETTSKAIFVEFPLKSDPYKHFESFPDLRAVIWTTTPWTIPANLALAFHPEHDYAVVRAGGKHYLVGSALVDDVATKVGWDDPKVVFELSGVNLTDAVFSHPIYGRDSIAVMADYVVMEEGTGIVHTAPGHGRDDFYTGLKYGLPVLCPVDERGFLTAEAGEFAGLSYRDCDIAVPARLKELGHLLAEEDYTHSYPFAERDGQPVIFRATEQWFVGIDRHNLRERLLQGIEDVRWVPETSRSRIQAMVGSRPDWCISRQRPWGVGIPIFYGKESKRPVLDPTAIQSVIDLVEREGSDAWFERGPEEILPSGYAHPETGETEFEKEQDVLDVWFDSGSTSFCVFDGWVEPTWREAWPPDLYLEGSDQHRGWFNTSLILGVALRSRAPYKAVLTHGFINDETGRKMSKRFGNVIDPMEACDQFGADVLRYWAASVDYTTDVPCSEALLHRCGEQYRRVRNTLRFLLANLYDYDPKSPFESWDVDEWIKEQVDLLVADCVDRYDAYNFNGALSAVHLFCANELSSFYLDAIKDRMYCDGKDWPSRRGAQDACYYVIVRLVKLIAPILPHTAEEVYRRIPNPNRAESVHVERFDVPTPERLDAIEGSDLQARIATLLSFRAQLFADFETWKQDQEVKDTQDIAVRAGTDESTVEVLRSFGADLPNLLKVSDVAFDLASVGFQFSASRHEKCDRCRLRRADVVQVGEHLLCERDRRVLGKS